MMTDKFKALIKHNKITPKHVEEYQEPNDLKRRIRSTLLDSLIKSDDFSSQGDSKQHRYHRSLKLAALKNPSIESHHLSKLVSDDDDEVADEAVFHPKTKPSSITDYIDFEDVDRNNRRLNVIDHPNTPLYTLHKLSEDEDEEVAEKASEALLHHPVASKHKSTYLDLVHSPFDHVATKAREILANKFNHDFDPEEYD